MGVFSQVNKIWNNPVMFGARLMHPNETAADWRDGNPGINPDVIDKYHRHSDGTWYENNGYKRDGIPDRTWALDPAWDRVVDPVTQKMLERLRKDIELEKGDTNRKKLPDILESHPNYLPGKNSSKLENAHNVVITHSEVLQAATTQDQIVGALILKNIQTALKQGESIPLDHVSSQQLEIS